MHELPTSSLATPLLLVTEALLLLFHTGRSKSTEVHPVVRQKGLNQRLFMQIIVLLLRGIDLLQLEIQYS